MRVTKTIRGYIEKTVNGVYADRIEAAEQERRQRISMIEAELATILQEAENRAADLVEEFTGFELRNRWGNSSTPATAFQRNSDLFSAELNSTINALVQERDSKIEQIVVDLELGGTKAELEAMLANL